MENKFTDICTFEVLYKAYLAARRGKRSRAATAHYEVHLLENIVNLVYTKIKYTPGNGNTTVGTLERAIFLLSVTELGRSASYANTEGTALSIASSLQIAYLNGSAVVQWTRSPYTNFTVNAYYLGTDGNVNYYSCGSTYGSRPAFTLPSTLSVSDDGSVSVNTAPTISGSYATGTNLGTKTAGFNLTYHGACPPAHPAV